MTFVGRSFVRGEIGPPSKLIVGILSLPKGGCFLGGLLLRGGEITAHQSWGLRSAPPPPLRKRVKVCNIMYIYIYIYIYRERERARERDR